ncbi:MAG: peptidylprolyl isomerase, partial [Nanoarchaeota archaeon]
MEEKSQVNEVKAEIKPQEPIKPVDTQISKPKGFSLFGKKPLFMLVGIIAVLLVGGWYFMHSNNDNNLSSALTAAAVTDQESSKVLAEINGEPIYQDEFDRETRLFFFLQGIPESYQSMVPKEQMLNNSITETLLLQKAAEAGYLVTEEEVEKVLDQNPSFDKDQFKGELAKNNIDYAFFMGFMAERMSIDDYLNASVFSDLAVTDKEAEDYYNDNKEQFLAQEEVKASHILVNESELALKIIEELDTGKDFAELAKDNSIDSNAAQGGDLGYFKKGAMVPEFETAAFSLKNIGDYTKTPVKTQFGYHII